ncbi:MAG: tRNA-guanine transglycosylase, partial [Geminicoccales bacterium]
CTPCPATLDDARRSMELSLAWAARSRRRFDELRDAEPGRGEALFGIVQGGVDAALRRRSVAAIAALAFDGIAIGGLSVGETKAQMAATLDVVAEALGDDPRARYLMGVGSPVDFFTAVERGVDLFDCVLPTRVARNGQLWTGQGRLNLRNARFLDDGGPIDPACACEACRNHSRAYLAHLFRADELLAYRLSSVHNVTYTLDLMRRIRGALADGSFASLRDVVATQYGSVGTGADKPPITGR